MNNEPVNLTLVVETYNLIEGTDRDRFRNAVRYALSLAVAEGGEVLIADTLGTPEILTLLANEFPRACRLDAVGKNYDQAKMMAAQRARGEFVVYLDGDCEPQGEWLTPLLHTLTTHPNAAGVGGYTQYRGGFIAKLLSVMDFGFMYPRTERDLQCYAFNNIAFRRAILLACPLPPGPLRCECFAHAQLLLRRHNPVMLAPTTFVLHDLPPLVRERTRQGNDAIAACWTNPALPEARWLRLNIFSLPLFYLMNVILDWKRVSIARHDLKLSPLGLATAFALFPLFRLLDVIGMARAFLRGPAAGIWGGLNL